MATIICPRTRPQMSTVRPGVMQKRERVAGATGEIVVANPKITAEAISIFRLLISLSQQRKWYH